MKKTYSPGKIDYNGSGRKNCKVTVEWELKETSKGMVFSMSGGIWNPRGSDYYTCGQCIDEIAGYFPNDAKLQSMLKVWERWHLNDMKAGCEHQRAEGWYKRPIDPSKPTDTYGKHFEGQQGSSWNLLSWVRKNEHPQGLMCEPCPTCGYKYGTAWLHEPIPDEVIAEIESW